MPPEPVVPDGPAPVAPVLPDVPSPVVLPGMPALVEPLPVALVAPVPPDILPVEPLAVEPASPVLPDMPLPAELLVDPAVPLAPVLPAVPAVEPSEVVPAAVLPLPPVVPDMVLLLASTLPVDGDAVVLGVVVLDVEAPGDVVSVALRSQPANMAVKAAVASIVFDSLIINFTVTPEINFIATNMCLSLMQAN